MLTVIGFNLIMLILLGLPLLSYTIAPDWTPALSSEQKHGPAGTGNARIALSGIGGALVIKGIVGLVG